MFLFIYSEMNGDFPWQNFDTGRRNHEVREQQHTCPTTDSEDFAVLPAVSSPFIDNVASSSAMQNFTANQPLDNVTGTSVSEFEQVLRYFESKRDEMARNFTEEVEKLGLNRKQESNQCRASDVEVCSSRNPIPNETQRLQQCMQKLRSLERLDNQIKQLRNQLYDIHNPAMMSAGEHLDNSASAFAQQADVCSFTTDNAAAKSSRSCAGSSVSQAGNAFSSQSTALAFEVPSSLTELLSASNKLDPLSPNSPKKDNSLIWTAWNNSSHRDTTTLDSASMISFNSSIEATNGEQLNSRSMDQLLNTKVGMVYSLLSMLGSQDRVDASQTLLLMSQSRETCQIMRKSCLPLLLQMLHPGDVWQSPPSKEDIEIAARATKALTNLVIAQVDERQVRRELEIHKYLEQIRAYSMHLRLVMAGCQQYLDRVREERITPCTGNLMRLSFAEEHRHSTCLLGGLQAIAELLIGEHLLFGDQHCDKSSVELRRFAGMSLTNLTFGDSNSKAVLCNMPRFLETLSAQVASEIEELRQVYASVLRNLSWKADSNSKKALREAGIVATLMKCCMLAQKETTLKSILSALWNLSAHSSENKEIICSLPGALSFLISTLTYKSESRKLAVVENGGGILRNISSHIAVKDDYRQILRDHSCLKILLCQLRSPSLTVVSNSCGTLWNLSARDSQDQQTLLDLGAVPMLRSLVHSKHRLIAIGSQATLKNLVTAAPPSSVASLEADFQGLMKARKLKALESDMAAYAFSAPDSGVNVDVSDCSMRESPSQQKLSAACSRKQPHQMDLLLNPSIPANTGLFSPSTVSTVAFMQHSSANATSRSNAKQRDGAPSEQITRIVGDLVEPVYFGGSPRSFMSSQTQASSSSGANTPAKVTAMKPGNGMSNSGCGSPMLPERASQIGSSPLIKSTSSTAMPPHSACSPLSAKQEQLQRDKAAVQRFHNSFRRHQRASSFSSDSQKPREAESDVLSPNPAETQHGSSINACIRSDTNRIEDGVDDSPKHYQLEDAPTQRKQSQQSQKPFAEDNASTSNPHPINVVVDNTVHQSESHFVGQPDMTPLIFSRQSSCNSLDSCDQFSIRSTLPSEYSQNPTGLVSPNDLPDSPGHTVPPSPKPERKSEQKAPQQPTNGHFFAPVPCSKFTAPNAQSQIGSSQLSSRVNVTQPSISAYPPIQASSSLDKEELPRNYASELDGDQVSVCSGLSGLTVGSQKLKLAHATTKSLLPTASACQTRNPSNPPSKQPPFRSVAQTASVPSASTAVSDDALLQECISAVMPTQSSARDRHSTLARDGSGVGGTRSHVAVCPPPLQRTAADGSALVNNSSARQTNRPSVAPAPYAKDKPGSSSQGNASFSSKVPPTASVETEEEDFYAQFKNLPNLNEIILSVMPKQKPRHHHDSTTSSTSRQLGASFANSKPMFNSSSPFSTSNAPAANKLSNKNVAVAKPIVQQHNVSPVLLASSAQLNPSPSTTVSSNHSLARGEPKADVRIARSSSSSVCCGTNTGSNSTSFAASKANVASSIPVFSVQPFRETFKSSGFNAAAMPSSNHSPSNVMASCDTTDVPKVYADEGTPANRTPRSSSSSSLLPRRFAYNDIDASTSAALSQQQQAMLEMDLQSADNALLEECIYDVMPKRNRKSKSLDRKREHRCNKEVAATTGGQSGYAAVSSQQRSDSNSGKSMSASTDSSTTKTASSASSQLSSPSKCRLPSNYAVPVKDLKESFAGIANKTDLKSDCSAVRGIVSSDVTIGILEACDGSLVQSISHLSESSFVASDAKASLKLQTGAADSSAAMANNVAHDLTIETETSPQAMSQSENKNLLSVGFNNLTQSSSEGDSLSEDNYSHPDENEGSFTAAADVSITEVDEELLVDCEPLSMTISTNDELNMSESVDSVDAAKVASSKPRIIKPSHTSTIVEKPIRGGKRNLSEAQRTTLASTFAAPKMVVRTTKTTQLRVKRNSEGTTSPSPTANCCSSNEKLTAIGVSSGNNNNGSSRENVHRIGASAISPSPVARLISSAAAVRSCSPRCSTDSENEFDPAMVGRRRHFGAMSPQKAERERQHVGNSVCLKDVSSAAKGKTTPPPIKPKPVTLPKPNLASQTCAKNDHYCSHENSSLVGSGSDQEWAKPGAASSGKRSLGKNVSSKIASLWKKDCPASSQHTKGDEHSTEVVDGVCSSATTPTPQCQEQQMDSVSDMQRPSPRSATAASRLANDSNVNSSRALTPSTNLNENNNFFAAQSDSCHTTSNRTKNDKCLQNNPPSNETFESRSTTQRVNLTNKNSHANSNDGATTKCALVTTV